MSKHVKKTSMHEILKLASEKNLEIDKNNLLFLFQIHAILNRKKR